MKTKLYFNSQYLPVPRGEYVLWCDGMGTGRMLTRSLARTATTVFKIHEAFDIALRDTDGRCYPVIDGVYITTPKRDNMLRILRLALSELAKEFILKRGTRHMFMIRAGLAYGATIHGSDVPPEAFYEVLSDASSRSFEEHRASGIDEIRKSLLLSAGMVHAFLAEKNAPPFGIFVHESAQSVPQLIDNKDKGFISNLYQWWREDEEAKQIAVALSEQIRFYLNKSKIHSVNEGYPVESMERHMALVEEYFGGLKK